MPYEKVKKVSPSYKFVLFHTIYLRLSILQICAF